MKKIILILICVLSFVEADSSFMKSINGEDNILAFSIGRYVNIYINDSLLVLFSKHKKYEYKFKDKSNLNIQFNKPLAKKIHYISQQGSKSYDAFQEIVIDGLFDNYSLKIFSETDSNCKFQVIPTSNNYDKHIRNKDIINFFNDKVFEQINMNSNDKKNFESLKKNDSLVYEYIVTSTYFGGSSYDFVRDMSFDKEGNIYTIGYTQSMDFYFKNGFDNKFDSSLYAQNDIVITKFDKDFKNVIFSTYLGCEYDDIGEGIIIDSSGIIFITGYTKSYDFFPVTKGAYDREWNSGYDGFIASISNDGSKLIASTLFGGELDEFIQDIEILDSIIYICGYTNSNIEFPYSNNAYSKVNKGKYDGFVASLKFELDTLKASTLLGGNSDDFIQEIKFNGSSSPYIVGFSKSNNYPKNSKNDYSSKTSDQNDIVITQFNKDFSQILMSAKIGGNKNDEAYSFGIDKSGILHLAGTTFSQDFPITIDAMDKKLNDGFDEVGISDICYLQFDPHSQKINYSTYIGGDAFDYATSLFVDKNNSIFLTGYTTSKKFPITAYSLHDTLQTIGNKKSDAFITKLNHSGRHINYSTFYGGDDNDVGHKIIVDDSSNIYVCGKTQSNIIILKSEIDSKLESINPTEMFFLKFKPISVNAILPFDTLTICAESPITINANHESISNECTIKWEPNININRIDTTSVIISTDKSMNYYYIVQDQLGNIDTNSIYFNVKKISKAHIFGKRFVYPDSIEKYYTNKYLNTNINWNQSGGTTIYENKFDSIFVQWGSNKKNELILTTENELNCIDTNIIPVYSGIPFQFKLNNTGKINICKGDSILLDAGKYDYYFWQDEYENQVYSAKITGTYYCHVADSNDNWGYSDTLFLVVDTLKKANIEGQFLVGQGKEKQYKIVENNGYSYQWEVENGSISGGNTGDSVAVIWSSDSLYGRIIVISENDNGCKDTTVQNIIIGKIVPPKLLFDFGSEKICFGEYSILNAGIGYLKYKWNTGDTNRLIKIFTTGNYWCDVVDVEGNNHQSDIITVEILEKPPKPIIIINEKEKFLVCSELADSYEWYQKTDSGNVIVGKEKEFHWLHGGEYFVVIINEFGCRNFSESFTDIDDIENDINYIIFPNPTTHYINIISKEKLGFSKSYLYIYNDMGELTDLEVFDINDFQKITYDFSSYDSGVYRMVILTGHSKSLFNIVLLK